MAGYDIYDIDYPNDPAASQFFLWYPHPVSAFNFFKVVLGKPFQSSVYRERTAMMGVPWPVLDVFLSCDHKPGVWLPD
ncbi:MAG: hypothetical protein WAN75_42475 [Xanthobacteraceae bacterium]|jgi:hypothetical protein